MQDLSQPDKLEIEVPDTTQPSQPELGQSKQSKSLKTMLVMLLGIGILTILVLFIKNTLISRNNISTQPSTTPTPTDEPKPPRELSDIATMSAFVSVEQSAAQLEQRLRAYTVYDNMLTAPSLEKPIKF